MITTTRQAPILLGDHYFCFNGDDNGGESFSLNTKIWNKEGLRYEEQEFCLNSYSNSAGFLLKGETISSDQFRKLANELDKKWSTLEGKEPASNEKLDTHVFTFILGVDNNTLSLITEYFDNGDDFPESIYINQRLVLQSYGNTAFITLCGAGISANQLRKLANELDHLMATITLERNR